MNRRFLQFSCLFFVIPMLLTACGGGSQQSNLTGETSGTDRNVRKAGVDSESKESSPGSSQENAVNTGDGIVSGVYDGNLSIGINEKGELTGYFESGRGDGGDGGPMFSCIFFIYGDAPEGGRYKISTWYPDAKPDNYIAGELTRVKDEDKPSLRLKLDQEHGGCTNVGSTFSDEDGSTFGLTSTRNWTGIRVVSSPKAHFSESADGKKPRKAFIVERDLVAVIQEAEDSVRVEFENLEGKKTEGWIRKSDLFEHVPVNK